jgi:hypothetical protein
MRQRLLILGVATSFTICLFRYFFALAQYVSYCNTIVYTTNHVEALLETSAVLVYAYAGFDFFKKRLAQ